MFDKLIFWMVNVFVYLRHPRAIVTFRRIVGYLPNVAVPRRYNEKMLWRKIFDHNPLFVVFSDKLATKKLQGRRCPDLDQAKVLWVGNDASEIPRRHLDRPVVVKASHGCGFNIIPAGGDPPNALPLQRINGWLGICFGQRNLEWAYQLVEPKLFVEERLTASLAQPLIEISCHAVNGTTLFIEVIVENGTPARKKGYFRPDGERWKAIEKTHEAGEKRVPLPDDFEMPVTYLEALEHSRALGAGVDYARFDFFSVGDRLYGGEITVYPGAGLTRHSRFINYNIYLSKQWDLLKSWFLAAQHDGGLQIYANALYRTLIRDVEENSAGSMS